jgi:hypothetical protein
MSLFDLKSLQILSVLPFEERSLGRFVESGLRHVAGAAADVIVFGQAETGVQTLGRGRGGAAHRISRSEGTRVTASAQPPARRPGTVRSGHCRSRRSAGNGRCRHLLQCLRSCQSTSQLSFFFGGSFEFDPFIRRSGIDGIVVSN